MDSLNRDHARIDGPANGDSFLCDRRLDRVPVRDLDGMDDLRA